MDKRLRLKIKEEIKQPMEISQIHLSKTIAVAVDSYKKTKTRNRIGFRAFLLRQIRYLGAWLWIPQGIVLVLVYILINADANLFLSFNNLPTLLWCSAILVCMTGLPMSRRSQKYNMSELELSTKASVGKMLLARLIITGVSNLFALIIIGLFTASHFNGGILSMIFLIMLPYLIACCGCVFILDRVRKAFAPIVCGVFCMGLLIASYVMLKYYYTLFSNVSTICLGLLSALCIAILALELQSMLKRSLSIELVTESK